MVKAVLIEVETIPGLLHRSFKIFEVPEVGIIIWSSSQQDEDLRLFAEDGYSFPV